MKNRIRTVALLALIVQATHCFAQSAQDSGITVLHPGVDSLKADLKAMIDLTLPAEQTQWENIDSYIDTFASGLDYARPIHVSVLTGTKPHVYLIWVPLTGADPFKLFRENMESLGYEISRDAKDRTLYQISQDPEYGLLRVHSDTRYAVFFLIEDKAALPALRDVILKATLPAKSADGSLSAEVLNQDHSVEAQQHRRESFGDTRKLALDKIQKRPTESETEFSLRRLIVTHQMDEGERLMAEGNRLLALLTLDRSSASEPTASLRLSGTAIPGSSLAQAIEEIGARPDAFAGLAKFDGTALSGRLNHPVDPMRQKNFLEFLDLTEQDMADRLRVSQGRTDTEKEVSKKVTHGLLNVIRASVKDGWMNGFVEAVPNGQGEFISVGAFTSPDAETLNTILPDLSKAGNGNLVEMNVAQQGSVSIHRAQLAEGYIDLIDKFFGVKKDVFVGVESGRVWLASGPGALEKLKQTIDSVKDPGTSDTPVHLEIKLLPWVKRFDEIAAKEPPGKTPEEQESSREWARRRARAIASFQNGGDTLVMSFRVSNGEVTGGLTVDHGLIRFAGKLMSAFSKTNFE